MGNPLQNRGFVGWENHWLIMASFNVGSTSLRMIGSTNSDRTVTENSQRKRDKAEAFGYPPVINHGWLENGPFIYR